MRFWARQNLEGCLNFVAFAAAADRFIVDRVKYVQFGCEVDYVNVSDGIIEAFATARFGMVRLHGHQSMIYEDLGVRILSRTW